MSPAKLLGLPQTEDSIIVRAGGNASSRSLPRRMVQGRAAADDGDTEGSSNVLRSLIAIRRRGAKE